MNAELRREILICIYVDFGEFERALVVSRQRLKQRRERLARLAPLRPEVDEYRNLSGTLEHSDLELFCSDIADVRACRIHAREVSEGSRGTLRRMKDRPEPPFGMVLTAIITPFNADGAVDYATFWKLIRYLGANGSDGVVVAGTTGESPTLSRAEKIALFKAAVDAGGDSMSVVAGVGTYDTRESVDLAQSAASVGVDGVMAVTPYYSKPPQSGIVAHMTAIADATDKPMMVYNIPSRTATLIEVDTMVELADHPRIGSVKDAVDDLAWSERCLEALPAGFAVYSGSDAMTKDLVSAGAVGVVSVSAHLAGREIAAMVTAVVIPWSLKEPVGLAPASRQRSLSGAGGGAKSLKSRRLNE